MSADTPNATRLGAPFTVIDDDFPASEPEHLVRSFVIETDDATPIRPATEIVALPVPEPPSRSRRGAGTYAVASLAILLGVYWVVSLAEWVDDQISRHSPLGYATLPFIAAALLFSVWWLWGEVLAWRRLVIADRLRADLSDTGHSQIDRDRFLSTLGHLAATMEGPQGQAIATFLQSVDNHRGADELRIILDHDVIFPMDDAAVTVIHRAVYDSFFLGLISPTPITDTAAFVLRATAMIRGVATAYGHRPGKLGLYRLIRRMIADVAILSGVMILMGRASSVMGQAINQASRAAATAVKASGVPVVGTLIGAAGELTGDVTEAVSEEIAEAVTAATRMAKLGLLAITVSRPITLNAERKRDMSSCLRRMVFTLRRSGQQKQQLKPRDLRGQPE